MSLPGDVINDRGSRRRQNPQVESISPWQEILNAHPRDLSLLRAHQDRFILQYHGDTGDGAEMPFAQDTQQGMRSAGPAATRRDNNVRVCSW